MRVRVLAAMTVAREFEALYVWGAQTGGARRLSVPESTITAIRENRSDGIPPEDSLIVDFIRHDSEEEAAPYHVTVPFYKVEYDFVLKPQ